jgi:hypothetical protein
MKITGSDKIGFGVLSLFLIGAIIIGFSNEHYFENNFAVEDGIVEWTTTLLLFASSVYLVSRIILLRKAKPKFRMLCTLLLSALFFFGAGEEISWGQRILGMETSEFFEKNNAQKETNFHNLVVGETKINKLIFGQLLTVILVIYLLIIPYFYTKWSWLNKLISLFGVPLPRLHHSIAFIAVTALIMIIPSSKRWEVYELAFAMIFFLIFLNPKNEEIYQKSIL